MPRLPIVPSALDRKGPSLVVLDDARGQRGEEGDVQGGGDVGERVPAALVSSHLCICRGVAASSPVVRARARVGQRGGRAQGRVHKRTVTGIRLVACCVWSGYGSLVPVPVSRVREAVRRGRRGGRGLGRAHG